MSTASRVRVGAIPSPVADLRLECTLADSVASWARTQHLLVTCAQCGAWVTASEAETDANGHGVLAKMGTIGVMSR